MAKTRAQRKAERRRREQAEQRGQQPGRSDLSASRRSAPRRTTQRPVSGEVAEAEAVIQTGAHTEDYGEHTVDRRRRRGPGGGSPVPGVVPAPVQPETEPEAPAPSRADVGAPRRLPARAEPKESRRDRREREKEERRKARAKELQKKGQAEKAEKRRGPILGFLLSCWAELKRVQWPDRDTLVQASAVTFIFVAVMAAYLGALDAAFNWFIKQLL